MQRTKRILIPGGKTSDISLVNAAHRLGYYVITSGNDANAPAHRLSDEYVSADYSNRECMLALAQEKRIDNMCSSANDIALISTTYVCEKMGLLGHDSYETTLTLHHKDRFKKLARRLALHVPDGEWFTDESEALEYALNVDHEIIIKPVDLVAGNGITHALTESDKREGIHKAFHMSLNKRIVIERFIHGTSHSFSAFIVNRKIVYSYSDNEYSFAGANHISTSAGPATDFEKVRDILIKDVEKVAADLNLVDGRLHTQYIMTPDGEPYILEITRRASGDMYTVPESRALGFDTAEWIVRAECGMDMSNCPRNIAQKGFTGRHCVAAPKPGTIKDIIIAPELESHIFDRLMWWNPGFEIRNCEKEFAGLIFYDFDNREQMLKIVERITDFIEFVFY